MLSLPDARQIVAELLAAEHPSLRVAGVKSEGGANYTEIVMMIAECHAEPCRITIGVDRETSEAAFRQEVSEQIRRHLQNTAA